MNTDFPKEQHVSKQYRSIAAVYFRQLRKWCRSLKPSRLGLTGAFRGQSSTEMIFTVLSISVVIITAVEGSIVLNRGMAVRQLAYEGARYAAANPGLDSATVLAFVSRAEPSVLAQGSVQATMSPTTTPRSQGTPVSVSITFTGSTVAMPSMVSFPATISATNVAMSE
jgi:hypothetical protein